MKDSQGWLAVVPWSLVAIVIALMCSGCTADAQIIPNPEPVPVWQAEWVRDSLGRAYSASQTDERSMEYAACLAVTVTPLVPGMSARFDITGVRFPKQKQSVSRDSIWDIVDFGVTAGCDWQHEIMLHTHSCHHWKRLYKRPDCPADMPWRFPSSTDWEAGKYVNVQVVQYAPDGFHFFWRESRQPWPEEKRDTVYLPRSAPVSYDTTLRRDLYLTGLALIPMVNLVGKVDQDPGGYVPKWDQWSVFHLTAGYTLHSVGTSLGLADKWTVPAVCTTGVGWELSQEFFDYRDALATCAGAFVSWGLRELWR